MTITYGRMEVSVTKDSTIWTCDGCGKQNEMPVEDKSYPSAWPKGWYRIGEADPNVAPADMCGIECVIKWVEAEHNKLRERRRA